MEIAESGCCCLRVAVSCNDCGEFCAELLLLLIVLLLLMIVFVIVSPFEVDVCGAIGGGGGGGLGGSFPAD